MKKAINLSLICILIFSFMFLVSCASKDESVEGDWYTEYGNSPMFLRVKDGIAEIFEDKYTPTGKRVPYTFDGETLILDFEDQDQVYTFKDGKLTTTDLNYDYTYSLVKRY